MEDTVIGPEEEQMRGEEPSGANSGRNKLLILGIVGFLVLVPVLYVLHRTLAGAEKGPEPRIYNGLGMEFVYIEPGTFMMGSPPGEEGRWAHEEQHQVTLTRGFYMQTMEVTQSQWKAVMGENPAAFPTCGTDCPVERVSWHDVQAFVEKLNQREDTSTYRLPTEAEWEYAARAGSTTAYSFGDDKSQLRAHAWYRGNGRDRTHRVGKKQPNAWGLHDVHGNVWEWVQDDFHRTYKEAPEDGSAWVDEPRGPTRTMRGGSWMDITPFCRSAMRFGLGPDEGNTIVGFRLVKSVTSDP